MKRIISLIAFAIFSLCLFSQNSIIIRGNSNSDINNISQIANYDNRIINKSFIKNENIDNTQYCFTTVNNYVDNYFISYGVIKEKYIEILETIEKQPLSQQEFEKIKKIKIELNDTANISSIKSFVEMNFKIIEDISILLKHLDRNKQDNLQNYIAGFNNQLSEITCSYDDYEITNYNGRTIIYRKNNPIGDVDLIVDDYKEGFARIKFNNKLGFIDLTGKIAIPPSWDYASNVADSIIIVRNGSVYYMIDTDGKIILNLMSIVDSVGTLNQGLIVIKKDDRYNYINKKGIKVFLNSDAVDLWLAKDFCFGYAPVIMDDYDYYDDTIYSTYYYIDTTGKISSREYDFASEFSPYGFAVVGEINYLYALEGKTNKYTMWVIDSLFKPVSLEYDNLYFLNNYCIITEKNNKIGLIDNNNVIKHECDFNYFDGFYGNIAVIGKLVGKKMKYGLINTNGMLLTAIEYYSIKPINNFTFDLYTNKNKNYKRYIVDRLGILFDITNYDTKQMLKSSGR